MEKQKKILLKILFFVVILLSNNKSYATNQLHGEIEFSEQYIEYQGLKGEEQVKYITPTVYEIPKTTETITNPLRIVSMLGSSVYDKYSLRTIIPENTVVRNQLSTNTCWAFANLASLESNLA